MYMNRRSFLKIAGLSGIGMAFADFGFDMSKVKAAVKEFKLKGAKEFTSVCHFCACGCSVIGHVREGKLINLEGAVDSPINRGSLCSKGVGYGHIPNSDQRPKTPLYRAPGSKEWKEISWDEAIDKAAHAIKKARDNGWVEKEKIDEKEYTVNRADGISFIGGSQVNNEECYALIKMTRALGGVFTDNQTRVCHATTPPALNAAFGRGAMTNPWPDMQNSKLIWIEGSNVAECHPMGMKGIMRAKERGAKIIHIDTRFTRTSKIADQHIQLRPGTDIAFLGAIISYILETKRYDEDYVKLNTNAYCLLSKDFNFEDGVFSGYNAKERSYNPHSWSYQVDAAGHPLKADTIDHPDTVYSKMKDHYKRYTFEMAEKITGTPAEKIKEAAELLITTKPCVMLYALGMTQHTVGVQNIRCFTILQLLLGNVGKPGTGIDAMRGQPNVQGSTDFGIMFQYLPGYLSYPTQQTDTLAKWSDANGSFRAKFLINLLKSWYGDKAVKENDYGYNYLPIRNSHNNDSLYISFEKMIAGQIKCTYVAGQNPMMSNANLNLTHKGLCNLDSLIVQDVFVNETAAFWERPGADPAAINTEVIFMPACSYLEREGTMINSMRMIQWRMAGPDKVGDSKADLWIVDRLFKKIRELYKDSTAEKDKAIRDLVWNYPDENMAEAVLKEINGYDLTTGKLLNGIAEIKDDGTTSTGLWIYAGIFGGGQNLSKRRGQADKGNMGIFPEYAWCWPDNIRILYNRASCDKDGKPLDEKNKIVWWDAAKGQWDGYDRPDVANLKDGPDTPGGQKPFRMNGEGFSRLFAADYKDLNADMTTRDHSYTPVDGPMPEFYEPVESPVDNILHKNQQFNPCVIYPRVPDMQRIGTKEEFPYVLCTSSLAEHWCSGTITRNIPWLNELVKEPFAEISKELAKKAGVKHGDYIQVRSARGEIKVKAMVTERAKPLMVNGAETHIVWMPYNWGFKGLAKGPSGNVLTIDALDPNVQEQEFKACLIDIKKA